MAEVTAIDIQQALSRRGLIARPNAITAILRQLRVEQSQQSALSQMLALIEAQLEREGDEERGERAQSGAAHRRRAPGRRATPPPPPPPPNRPPHLPFRPLPQRNHAQAAAAPPPTWWSSKR
jgi:hypothetical protein